MNEVILVCEGKEFSVSKDLLCDASPFFEAMFHSDFREAHTGQVYLDTINADIMGPILSFLATGKHPNFFGDSSAWIKLLTASHLLQIPALVIQCLCEISKFLTPSLFAEPWTLASLYENRGLEAKIRTMVATNWRECVVTSDFLHLTVFQIKDVLLHYELKNLPAVDVFKGVMRWIENDYTNRVKYQQEFLNLIDIRALSRSEVENLIHNHSSLKEFTESQLIACGSKANRSPADKTLSKGTTLFCFGVTKTKRMQTMFSVTKNTWSHSSELQPPLTYGHYGRTLPIVYYGGYVIFIGFNEEASVTEPANVIHAYCPIMNEVVGTCSLSYAVIDAAASVLHGWTYIVSSPSITDASQGARNLVQRYSVACGVCEVVASTVEKLSSPYVFTFKDNLHVIGLAEEAAHVEKYDSISNQWTAITSISTPNPFAMCAAALCNDKLCILEESDPKTFFVYSFQSKAWRRRRIDGYETKMWELWAVSDNLTGGTYLLGKDNFSVMHSCRGLSLPIWEKVSEPNADLWHWSHTVVMNI